MTATQVGNIASARDLRGMRIEEGKKREIPQTADPLDGTWTKPDPELRKLIFMQQGGIGLTLALILLPIFLVLIMAADSESVGPLAILIGTPYLMLLALAFITTWASEKMAENHRFRITDEELVIENGLISINRTLIPLTMVQQVNVVETWMSRQYGMKYVVVNTAGFVCMTSTGPYGGAALMGFRDPDSIADAILSRVKHAKSKGA